jgi:hypothetical protein
MKIQKVVGVNIGESVVCEQLAQHIPSLLETLTVHGTLRRQCDLVAVKIAPNCTETSACFIGQGNFGVGIRRLVGLNRPSPETRKVKPPNLPILFKSKILKWMLPVLLYAGH